MSYDDLSPQMLLAMREALAHPHEKIVLLCYSEKEAERFARAGVSLPPNLQVKRVMDATMGHKFDAIVVDHHMPYRPNNDKALARWKMRLGLNGRWIR